MVTACLFSPSGLVAAGRIVKGQPSIGGRRRPIGSFPEPLTIFGQLNPSRGPTFKRLEETNSVISCRRQIASRSPIRLVRIPLMLELMDTAIRRSIFRIGTRRRRSTNIFSHVAQETDRKPSRCIRPPNGGFTAGDSAVPRDRADQPFRRLRLPLAYCLRLMPAIPNPFLGHP